MTLSSMRFFKYHYLNMIKSLQSRMDIALFKRPTPYMAHILSRCGTMPRIWIRENFKQPWIGPAFTKAHLTVRFAIVNDLYQQNVVTVLDASLNEFHRKANKYLPLCTMLALNTFELNLSGSTIQSAQKCSHQHQRHSSKRYLISISLTLHLLLPYQFKHALTIDLFGDVPQWRLFEPDIPFRCRLQSSIQSFSFILLLTSLQVKV